MDTKNKKPNILINIPVSNSGKYRFKTRDNKFHFGNSFATREKEFTKNVYLEWQIGYDVTTADFKKEKKKTTLNKISFIGANGKEKYPYELSEFIFEALDKELINIEDFKNLLNKIQNYKQFIDEKNIEIEPSQKFNLNEIEFEETSIKLPTLFYLEDCDNTQIEIAIEKQQYATGIQPMIYFCIPITSFSNYESIMGRSSQKGDMLKYIIDEKNIKILLDLLQIFGMASQRHNEDIIEIMKILISLKNNA